MTPEVSVVVPLYRTGAELPELYGRTVAALDGRTFELVLVDDACPEGSGRIAAELAAEDERVRMVALTRNVGQHAAALTGLAHARGGWTVVLDGDLQDPPEAIPLLLDAGRVAGVPVVFAGRRGRYESRTRLLTSRMYKRALALAAGVPADAGIFMALDRGVAERLVALGGRRRPSLVAMVGCLRVPMISVPVERTARSSGRSSYGAVGRLRLGLRAIAWALAWRLRGAR
jgi:glycosyltransferase involved in cell wall biosynthesis